MKYLIYIIAFLLIVLLWYPRKSNIYGNPILSGFLKGIETTWNNYLRAINAGVNLEYPNRILYSLCVSLMYLAGFIFAFFKTIFYVIPKTILTGGNQ